ncbi:hypothetical protein FQN57_003710 [Myotisia sp. PD_48]|nr:hypothetical protein FQN57_003710 [Myotisia sp. PD_48]
MSEGFSLNDVLDLEEEYYTEGYILGTRDGKMAGDKEGSIFAVVTAFEKAQLMGRLYGKGIVWAQYLQDQYKPPINLNSSRHHWDGDGCEHEIRRSATTVELLIIIGQIHGLQLSLSPRNLRLEKHISAFLVLVNPLTLALHNTEEEVSQFDQRLKKAVIKAKIIERMLGEQSDYSTHDEPGESNIEDKPLLPALRTVT